MEVDVYRIYKNETLSTKFKNKNYKNKCKEKVSIADTRTDKLS